MGLDKAIPLKFVSSNKDFNSRIKMHRRQAGDHGFWVRQKQVTKTYRVAISPFFLDPKPGGAAIFHYIQIK
jgi:hypothetical protein